MPIAVMYAREDLIPSFHACLDLVAREKIYIEMIEAPPLERVAKFQKDHIAANGPVYYAVEEGRVVGWCDVFPEMNPRQNHRGSLGMGLLPGYRGQGIGTELAKAVIQHSRQSGLEKIELQVYNSNLPALALYRKLGFSEEGYSKNYRKLDGIYYDCISMALFLN